jgi:hypothetical protein
MRTLLLGERLAGFYIGTIEQIHYN